MSATGTATTVKGTLNVDQAVSFDTTLAVTGVSTLSQTLNVGAHIVATVTTAAKNVSNTASDLYTRMNNKRQGIDSMGGEETRRETERLLCDYTLTHTHTHTHT
jgi:type V secretory pathway adhesin AidA